MYMLVVLAHLVAFNTGITDPSLRLVQLETVGSYQECIDRANNLGYVKRKLAERNLKPVAKRHAIFKPSCYRVDNDGSVHF